jgi:hypothetical protein
MGVEPPRMLVGRIQVRRVGSGGALRSPSEKVGLRPQNNDPKYDAREGAVIGHMLASASATIAVGGHA